MIEILKIAGFVGAIIFGFIVFAIALFYFAFSFVFWHWLPFPPQLGPNGWFIVRCIGIVVMAFYILVVSEVASITKTV